MSEDEIKTWIKENLELTAETQRDYYSSSRSITIRLKFTGDEYAFSTVYVDLPGE